MAKNYSKGRKSGKEYPRKDNKSKDKHTYTKECIDKQDNLNDVVSNDIKYYNKVPSLFVPATQVPWAQIQGNPCNWWIQPTVEDSYNYGDVQEDVVIPGIMAIDFVPTIGWAEDVQSPINRATNIIMTNLYSKLGASTLPFAEADLALFLASMGSIACTIAYLSRAIRSTKMFLPMNINYPRAVLQGMGFDYDAVVRNTPTYLVRLNALIRAFNNFRTPNFIDVYVRQFALANNIYLDEDSQESQMYLFNPIGIYRYHDIESMATFESFPVVGSNYVPEDRFDKILDQLELSLNAWRNSQDLYYINGVLQRAYKDADFLFIPEVMETDLQLPALDRNISMQITNMIITPVNRDDLTITQDPVKNCVICKPTAKLSPAFAHDQGAEDYLMNNWVLRSFDATTSPEDNMEMTRLTNFYGSINGADSSTVYFNLENCGPELVHEVRLISYRRSTDTVVMDEVFTNLVFSELNAQHMPISTTLTQLENAFKMSVFKYHPTMLLCTLEEYNPDEYRTTLFPLGDIYRYTPLKRDKWELLQTAAMYSLYSVKLPESTVII